MTLLEELETLCPGGGRADRPGGRRPRARLGRRLRRRDRPGAGADERPQPAPRRSHGHVRRRPQRAAARVAGSDADLDIAVIEVDTGDVEPVRVAPGGRSSRRSGAPCWRSPTPAAAACASRRGSCRRPRAASAARAGAGSPARSSTPRRSRGAPRADRCVDTAGRLLGINSVRVDGGLILAIPADAALRERVEALGRGEAPEAGPARRRDRAAAGGAAPASRGRTARARRRARPRGRGGQRRPSARASSAAI